MQYVHVEVRTSEYSTACLTIPSWEVPVLRLLHPDGAVEVTGRKLVNRRRGRSVSPLTPENEFERMKRCYPGKPGQTPKAVEVAYGYGEQGIAALAAAMAAEKKLWAGDPNVQPHVVKRAEEVEGGEIDDGSEPMTFDPPASEVHPAADVEDPTA